MRFCALFLARSQRESNAFCGRLEVPPATQDAGPPPAKTHFIEADQEPPPNYSGIGRENLDVPEWRRYSFRETPKGAADRSGFLPRTSDSAASDSAASDSAASDDLKMLFDFLGEEALKKLRQPG